MKMLCVYRCYCYCCCSSSWSGVMALVFTLTHVFSVVTASPEDWPSGPPFGHVEDPGVFTKAFINVTKEEEGEWKSQVDELGRYGGGYVGPAYGVIVHVTSDKNPDDHTGCELPFRSSRTDGKLPQPGEPWIALIKRGKCNFEAKVDNAFKSNAAGVLVYNDRDSNGLEKMKLANNAGRNISAVFTYKWKGEELARLADNDTKVMVHITIGPSTTSRTSTINSRLRRNMFSKSLKTSVLFVSITFIVLMIISLAWLVFYYVQRFRYIHAKDRLSRRLGNAAKKALSKIPTKSLKSDDKEIGDGECCAICIEPYKLCDVIRMLPCTHEFHKGCIDPWLLEHRTCPMCKMDILKHYGFVFTGSQESILQMEIEEVVGLDSSSQRSPRRAGGISPLPEIRAVVVTDHQRLFDSSGDDQSSSRASTPDELTPSLPQRHQSTAVRQDLCVGCIAAAAAAAIAANNSETEKLDGSGPSNSS